MAEEIVVIEGVVEEVKIGITPYHIPLKIFRGERNGEPFAVTLVRLIHDLEVGDRIRVRRREEG